MVPLGLPLGGLPFCGVLALEPPPQPAIQSAKTATIASANVIDFLIGQPPFVAARLSDESFL